MSVSRGWKYMIKTTYYYGGVNGKGTPPPVFDQIVDGTFWGIVNTTADYADCLASYYEGVFMAQGKSISVCIASNSYTTSDPSISALELVRLDGDRKSCRSRQSATVFSFGSSKKVCDSHVNPRHMAILHASIYASQQVLIQTYPLSTPPSHCPVPYAYGALYKHPMDGLLLDTVGSTPD